MSNYHEPGIRLALMQKKGQKKRHHILPTNIILFELSKMKFRHSIIKRRLEKCAPLLILAQEEIISQGAPLSLNPSSVRLVPQTT